MFDKTRTTTEPQASRLLRCEVLSSKATSTTSRRSSSTAPADTGRSRTYTVVAGDSLSKIAKREFGDANKWHAIYDANRDKIKDPDLIHPGQVLTLPSNI